MKKQSPQGCSAARLEYTHAALNGKIKEPKIDSYEMSFREVARAVGQGKWIIGTISVLTFVAVATYSFFATRVYRAEAIVQPRQEQVGGAGLFSGPLSGVADLAGLNFAQQGDRAVALATLTSRAVVQPFIRERGLMRELYETDWNAETGTWSVDPVPTEWEAYARFTERVLDVSEDRKSGLVTVAVEWKDPRRAQEWVTDLIARTNVHLKTQAIEEGERNLSYLEGQSRKIGQVELQQAIYNLIEAELKKVMLAKGASEFALKTIDPAVVPTGHLRPKRLLLMALGLAVGVMLGVGLVVLMDIWKRVLA